MRKLLLILFIYASFFITYTLQGNEDYDPISTDTELMEYPVNYKKILVYCDKGYRNWPHYYPYIPWFFYDPLITSQTVIKTELKIAPGKEDFIIPNLSKDVISGYDLVVISVPHLIEKQYTEAIIDYLNNGGALMLVHPLNITERIQKRIGIDVKGSNEIKDPIFSRQPDILPPEFWDYLKE